MIGQQINLYQDRFKEKKLWGSARQVVAATVLLLTATVILSYLLHSELDEAKLQKRLIQANRQILTAELASANAELTRLLENSQVDQELETMARQISARKSVLNFVDANRFGSGKGFSDYLVALSQLHQDEIWLSQISLAENFVQIKGSSLSADKIPGYFDRFSSEEIFRGKRFDIFEMSRAGDTDWKVDFEISTSGALDE